MGDVRRALSAVAVRGVRYVNSERSAVRFLLEP